MISCLVLALVGDLKVFSLELVGTFVPFGLSNMFSRS